MTGEIPPNSERGRKARAALFNIFLNPDLDPNGVMSARIRSALGGLFSEAGRARFEIKAWTESKINDLLDIAVHVEQYQRNHGPGYDAAIADAAEHFGRPKKTVARAYTRYREFAKIIVDLGFGDPANVGSVTPWESARLCREAGLDIADMAITTPPYTLRKK